LRIMRWLGHMAHMWGKKGTYRVLMEKLEAKRPLGGSRHRWNYNIKKDLKEIGWGSVDWIYLSQVRDN
jgi:hypothetical protein